MNLPANQPTPLCEKATPSTSRPRRVHVFVDAENLSAERLPLCELPSNLQLTVITGKTTKRAAWERRFKGSPVGLRFIEMKQGGPNALDFLLAFYVGEAVQAHSGDLDVVVVSRDKGFDPLIAHLCTRQIRSRRVESLEFLPIALHIERMTLPQRVAYAAEKLREYDEHARERERWQKVVDRIFQYSLTDEATAQVVSLLLSSGVLQPVATGTKLVVG